MEEIWKDIEGYDNRYLVSNIGRVKRKEIFVRKNNSITRLGERIMPIWKNKHGYSLVRLSLNGRADNKLLHRLVAIAFVPNPNNKPEVNHINTIRDDNRACNLNWMTRSENVQYSYDMGTKVGTKSNIGKKGYKSTCGKAIRSTDIKTGEVKEYGSMRVAAEKEILDHRYISNAIKNNTIYDRCKWELINPK